MGPEGVQGGYGVRGCFIKSLGNQGGACASSKQQATSPAAPFLGPSATGVPKSKKKGSHVVRDGSLGTDLLFGRTPAWSETVIRWVLVPKWSPDSVVTWPDRADIGRVPEYTRPRPISDAQPGQAQLGEVSDHFGTTRGFPAKINVNQFFSVKASFFGQNRPKTVFPVKSQFCRP